MENINRGCNADNLLSTLQYMKNEFGMDIFHDMGRMSAILIDLSPTLKRDSKILQRLHQAGMFQELEETDFTNEIRKMQIQGRIKNWLIDEAFIQEERAVYYSQVLCAVYGGNCENIVQKELGIYQEEVKKSVPIYKDEEISNDIVKNKGTNFIIKNGMLEKYIGTDENVVIPNEVVKIEMKAFSGCRCIKSIKLSNNLEVIRECAFEGCENLENVEFSDGLKEIKDEGFRNCRRIKSIKLPKSLEKIGSSAFFGCYDLESIEFSEGLKEIEGEGFSSCRRIKSVKLPKSLEKIGYSAFFGCYDLESIEFSEGLKEIASDGFRWCTSVKKVKLPESLEKIGSSTFSECESEQNRCAMA